MIRRGDVVIVEIPFTDVPGAKKRPALVVQNDTYNHTIRKTVVVIFTGNLRAGPIPVTFTLILPPWKERLQV